MLAIDRGWSVSRRNEAKKSRWRYGIFPNFYFEFHCESNIMFIISCGSVLLIDIDHGISINDSGSGSFLIMFVRISLYF